MSLLTRKRNRWRSIATAWSHTILVVMPTVPAAEHKRGTDSRCPVGRLRIVGWRRIVIGGRRRIVIGGRRRIVIGRRWIVVGRWIDISWRRRDIDRRRRIVIAAHHRLGLGRLRDRNQAGGGAK